jgi:hypothetical protein
MRRYAVQFDAASFYDQFALADGVSRFFCFRLPGRAARYTRLPMGFRPACSIAQAAMEVLADVGVAGVTAVVYIDNVLFTGDDESAVRCAAEVFKARCRSAAVTLNEEDGDVVPVFDFLGVEYDLSKQCMCNTAKTEAKLRAALAAMADPKPMTLRQLAAVFRSALLGATGVPAPAGSVFLGVGGVGERSLSVAPMEPFVALASRGLPRTWRRTTFSRRWWRNRWACGALFSPCVLRKQRRLRSTRIINR